MSKGGASSSSTAELGKLLRYPDAAGVTFAPDDVAGDDNDDDDEEVKVMEYSQDQLDQPQEADPARDWLMERLDQEVETISAQGVKPIPLLPRTMGHIVEGPKYLNRVEVQTNFPFNTVKQMMLSEPEDYPLREGYRYINVLLFTGKPVPIIVPYVYQHIEENDLQHWILVNGKGEEVTHKVTFSQ